MLQKRDHGRNSIAALPNNTEIRNNLRLETYTRDVMHSIHNK